MALEGETMASKLDVGAKMTGSTTMADWFGTAMTNAAVAASLLEQARVDGSRSKLDRASELLQRALADGSVLQAEALKTL